jgi:hypothetical protein
MVHQMAITVMGPMPGSLRLRSSSSLLIMNESDIMGVVIEAAANKKAA